MCTSLKGGEKIEKMKNTQQKCWKWSVVFGWFSAFSGWWRTLCVREKNLLESPIRMMLPCLCFKVYVAASAMWFPLVSLFSSLSNLRIFSNAAEISLLLFTPRRCCVWSQKYLLRVFLFILKTWNICRCCCSINLQQNVNFFFFGKNLFIELYLLSF